MKLLKKFVSILMAAALVALNVHPSLIAYAETDYQAIASSVFGFEPLSKAHCIFYNRYTEQVDVNGSTKTAYTETIQCAIDPRITGSVNVLWGYSSYSRDQYMSVTVDDNNHYFKRISNLGDYRELCLIVEYTPSEEDVTNGIHILTVTGDNKYWTGETGKLWDRITYNWDSGPPYYPEYIESPVAGTTYDLKGGRAFGIVLDDMYNYLTTGISTVDPTSSFSSTSVTKKYGDTAFSAGFMTNSDGTVSYSSSNKNVATISSTGAITIKGVGTTTITATTSETASYCADSKTMTLTVNKGTLSVSAIPTATSIQYGQTISASNISGGAIKDQANNTITGGNWSWKSPNTTPSGAGTTQCVAVYTLNNSNYK